MSRYRRSGNDLAYGDDYGGGGGGGDRWDRDKFERLRARSRGGNRGSDSFRYEEDDYSSRRGGPVDRRDIRVEVDENRYRRGSGRDYNDRYAYDDDRSEPARRTRPSYLDDRYNQPSGRELAPYRPQPARQQPSRYERYAERDYYDVPDRKPQRPQFIRRQTSLDFDDRRQRTRYGDEDDLDVNVNVNLREAEPKQPRYDYNDEDYRDVHIWRERERDIYRRRKESSSSEEEEIVERPRRSKKAKKAHTVFPKRLASLRAILEFGHPYTEDENFYYVVWNSTQVEINEVLEKSKGYNQTKTLMIEASAPSPPPPEPVYEPPEQEEIIATTTTKIIENPTDEELARYNGAGSVADRYERAPSVAESRRSELFDKTAALSIKSPSPSRSGRRGRSKSRPRGDQIFYEEEVDRGALILPAREKSRERIVKYKPARPLEELVIDEPEEKEEKTIRYRSRPRGRYEENDEIIEDDYEIVDEKEIRLERGKSGQMQLERDAPKRSKSKRARRPTKADVKAAMFSLT